jgi:predicted FMN-binding regulatory protein PaiB
MYLPKAFEESRIDVLQACMVEHPFATVVSIDNALAEIPSDNAREVARLTTLSAP